MAVLITAPWLGLLPAVALLIGRWRYGSRIALVAAAAWLLYVPYEYAMLRRWLCSGECNIRVDLLLIYPALLLLTITGAIALVRIALRRRAPPR